MHFMWLRNPMTPLRLALAASLMLATAAEASAACNLRGIAGTWAVNVSRTVDDVYFPGPTTDSTTCWFVIRQRGNMAIHCDRAWLDERVDFFAQFQTDFEQGPWHQIGNPIRSTLQTTNGRRFPTPNRCEWTITDRNDIDIDYTVRFSPDLQSLSGSGRGFQDKHFGSTEPMFVSFSGVRQ